MTGASTFVQPSFFEVNDHSTVRPRDLVVRPCSAADVQNMCARWHYSRGAGHIGYRHGLWDGDVLYGVSLINAPVPNVQECVFGSEHAHHVMDLQRLALPDDAPRNCESRLISGSLRLLKQQRPDVWAVVTYADTTQGHVGTIYQATNALYTGTGRTTYAWVDSRGVLRSKRSSGGGRGDHGGISKAEAEARGWTRVDSKVKHRYLYLLPDSRKHRRELLALLQLPVLPYPKTHA